MSKERKLSVHEKAPRTFGLSFGHACGRLAFNVHPFGTIRRNLDVPSGSGGVIGLLADIASEGAGVSPFVLCLEGSSSLSACGAVGGAAMCCD